LAAAAGIIQHQPFFNLVVTNVPGPPVPLYALGAKLLEAFPLMPLAGNQSLAVAALSYEGQLNLGVLSDPATCPDAEVFSAGIRSSLKALVEQSGVVQCQELARLERGTCDDQGPAEMGPSSLHRRRPAVQTAVMTTTSETVSGAPDNVAAHPDSPAAGVTHGGDLARRVAHRREELGMTVEELAQRAGVDPTYLAYFEQSADARLSAGTLNLLALVLDTNPIDLLGGEFDHPPGEGRAGRHPSLEVLTSEQCEAHLGVGGVGRVVFNTERGPVAVPVNFEYSDGQIVVSTDVTKADFLEALPVVGFEIDRVDDTLSEGWSVLVSGRASLVDDPDELLRLSSLDLEAWAGGNRHALIRITPTDITGRVIVHYATPDED
jgi:nitroimidazol reductase NimA-like FMN-containing flavoprotein (pyridoxamine 5'-phosphate oxidase superfamily)/ribosome-binding protein aMBF1 (putative translation factor)